MKKYQLQSGLLDRKRKLNLTKDYIEFENKDLKDVELTRFNKSDIIDFKRETNWIVWYKFTVGQHFKITLKNKLKEELEITFRNYFGLKRNYQQVYSEIINTIWEFYHTDIVNEYLDKFYKNEDLKLLGLSIDQNGIVFEKVKQKLNWNEVTIQDYSNYFVIYKTDNPTIYSTISSNEYLSETLWSIIKTILKDSEFKTIE